MIIIEGAGEKAFCAGGDIRAITDSKGSPSQGDFFTEEYQAQNCTHFGQRNETRNEMKRKVFSIPFVAQPLDEYVSGSIHRAYRRYHHGWRRRPLCPWEVRLTIC